MKLSRRFKRFLWSLMFVALLFAVVMTVYYASIPQRYAIAPGDASAYDLTAPRSIRDRQETNLRAAVAAASVSDVMLRSEQIVSEVKEKVDQFFVILDDIRENPPLPTPTPSPIPTPTPPPADEEAVTDDEIDDQEEIDDPDEAAEPDELPVNPNLVAEEIQLRLDRELQIIMNQEDALAFAMLSDDRYNSIRGHIQSLTNLIMADTVDQSGLRNAINDKIDALEDSMAYFREDASLIERSLAQLLRPNVVFDHVATENARQAAYDTVQNNPVMIEKGSRIVSLGEIVTDETYVLLMELSLIDDGSFDYQHFAGILLLLLLLLFIAWFYLKSYDHELFRGRNDYGALLLAMLIPFLVSAYIGRQLPLAPPIYFAAVLIAVYFSFRAAVILSFLLIALVFPITNFDPVFLIVAVSGSIVAALFTKGILRKDNYAFIILATAGINFLVTFSLGLLQKDSWTNITINCAYTAFSGALSVIAAIGIMPLFEMLFNTVSPLRLIELSQPGHPLLRRLFVEAPGTSQHSMMVANLSDAAASAIGANPLLARVGSYYHDIGKLETPHLFIENQEGENPHDHMMPDHSAKVILSHPDAGLRIGKRYRLPSAILRIIHEHHGSTSQAYFYHKAQKMAEAGKMPEPQANDYRYHCPIPSSRESAIVMLADSLEAAMKSANLGSLKETEGLLKKIIKTKTDQDQLAESGLSFRDLELINKAFMQVYAGHFHERIAYPDDRSSRQPAKQT